MESHSESLLRAVSDLGDAVFVAEGRRLLAVNDAMCDMLGYTREELLALPDAAALVAPQARRDGGEPSTRFLDVPSERPSVSRGAAVLVARDGRRVEVEYAVRASDLAGTVQLFGAMWDVTESRRALRLEQRRRRQLSALRDIEIAAAGMLDLDEMLETVAAAVVDLLGVRHAVLVVYDAHGGEHVRAVGLDQEQQAQLLAALAEPATRAALVGRRSRNLHDRALQLPAGHPLVRDAVAASVPDADRPLGILLAAGDAEGTRVGGNRLDDIDRRTVLDLAGYVAEHLHTIEAYQHERSVAAELRRIDETRDLLLSAVSHDLRDPLAAIMTMAETLELRGTEMDADSRARIAERIRLQASRLIRIVTDLLDLDRLRRGGLVAERAAASVSELVEHVVAGLDRGDAEQIAVTAQNLTVEVDGPKVERILDNLVRNALRHAGDDGKVWIRACMVDDELELVVEDTGPGVPRDMRERIFAPFESGSPDRFGLGLALVERLARVQGGRASVAEREGGGARFVVRVGTTPAVVAGSADPAGSCRVPVDPVVRDRLPAEGSDEHGARVAEGREQRR